MENYPYQEHNQENENRRAIHTPVTVGEWMVTMLIMTLPIVNIVMLFVWAFSADNNPSKTNWAKATLIWMTILFVVYLLLAIVFGSIFANMMRGYY